MVQRLRIRFSRGEEVKYISHLDIMRLWQRALLRSGMALAYSEGFSPHPRMSLAAPLAVGVTSDAELMDIILAKPVSPHNFVTVLNQQLPAGIRVSQAQAVALTLPSLPAQVRFAEYEVEIETAKGPEEIEATIRSLLARDKVPWEHRRDTGPKKYDLRALIDDVWLIECREGGCVLGMRLRCDANGSGRPEQVTRALGLSDQPRVMCRTRLVLVN